jgi:hypothetical protein
MDIRNALDILEIETTQIDYKYLKKKYYKLALRYHPDKNQDLPESCEKFQKINEAYHFLCRELNMMEEDDNCKMKDEDSQSNSTIYMDLLNMFMKGIFEGKYNDIIFKIIQEIVLGCKKISLKLFEDLDKDTCLKVYCFLVNNRNTLHLNESILINVREIVQQKYSNVIVYKLNPSINDLINNNIFKLNVFDEICYVPLWINESYFEIGDNEIITLCEPDLPDNITIDQYNNLYFEKNIPMEELINFINNNSNIQLEIGNKLFEIPIQELKCKKEQLYIIKKMGILKADDLELESYLQQKADIIVTIKFQ